jgi:hypothetical protein
MTNCVAQTKSGQPCRAQAIHDSQYCFCHDPAQADARAEARKRGGERRRVPHAGDPSAIPTPVRSTKAVLAILDYALAETLALENSVARTRALIALSVMYLTVLRRVSGEESSRKFDEEIALYGWTEALERMAPPLTGPLTNVGRTQEGGPAGIAADKRPPEAATGTRDPNGHKPVKPAR